MVFSQFKFPANLAQIVVPKMHCLYANAVVQPSVQHSPYYMAWKTRVHIWCRHCHLCINASMWREKRWLQGLFDPLSYINNTTLTPLARLLNDLVLENKRWDFFVLPILFLHFLSGGYSGIYFSKILLHLFIGFMWIITPLLKKDKCFNPRTKFLAWRS